MHRKIRIEVFDDKDRPGILIWFDTQGFEIGTADYPGCPYDRAWLAGQLRLAISIMFGVPKGAWKRRKRKTGRRTVTEWTFSP